MRRKVFVRGGFAALLAFALLLAALAVGMAEETEEAPAEAVAAHNYILVIDNSRSTTGRHSLGEATDPKGLRFDAAKLVYQNVVSSAATGSRGQLGVIVFCGPKNCVTYGPMGIDDEALDEAIGSHLNEAANASRRDAYTDIRTALEAAQGMMEGFEGDTSVILLTDGVNDLTNQSNPFSRPENIEANERSVEIVQEMREAGADFYVIALTSRDSVAPTDPFMEFINRLAEAGGGDVTEDGNFGNVLMATQDDLNSKLLQMLIRAESASEVQTIAEYTPVRAPFRVPYDGITDATVNITFMPEDKPLLEKAELVDPDGATYTLWDRDGAHDQAGITVTEHRSYIMFSVPSPRAGDWSVVVTSRKDARGNDSRVLINAVVRFNHNLRLRVEMDSVVTVGDTARIDAWFQAFNGEAFEDLEDSDIYSQSTAQLTVHTPAGNQKTVTMKQEGSRYTLSFRAKAEGTWSADIRVRNPYVEETADGITFEVTALATPTPQPAATATSRPTPRPTPAPTPTPEVVPIRSLALSIEPSVTTEGGETLVGPGNVTFSWTLEEETDSVEAVMLDGDRVLGSVVSGAAFDSAFFQPGKTYALRVSAMPKNGELVGAEPTVATLPFRAAPQPFSEEAILLEVGPTVPDSDDAVYIDRNADAVTLSWEVAGEADSVRAELLEDGEVLLADLQSGDSVPRDRFRDGAEYALRVSAVPRDGELAGVGATEKTLAFLLYPLPEPIPGLALDVTNGTLKDGVARIRGNTAQLAWRHDGGNVDHYELRVTDAGGAQVLNQVLNAGQAGYSLSKTGRDDWEVRLLAWPRYATEERDCAVATVGLHSLSFLEKFWYFIAAGAALLAAGAVAAFLLLKDRNAKRVTGSLRVRCEALGLDKLLTFYDDRKGVKVGDPITRHPELAKLKDKRALALLGNVRLDNAMTDRDGRAPGEDPEAEGAHRPNVKVLRLTCTNPATKAQEVRCVGRYDVAPATLSIGDSAGTCEFTFSGS